MRDRARTLSTRPELWLREVPRDGYELRPLRELLVELISFAAFYFSAETKDLDIAEIDPVYGQGAVTALGGDQ